ncbi:MAG: hypothetical protein Q9180_006031, partial [Flavoplaca navasiana]
MSASSKKGQDSRSNPLAMGVSFPSGTTDPTMEEHQFVYVVIEVSHDLTIVPTLAFHLRGISIKLEDAVNAAWNRIDTNSPQSLWVPKPREIVVMGKELYLTAVEADG